MLEVAVDGQCGVDQCCDAAAAAHTACVTEADDDSDDAELSELHQAQHIITVPNFSPASRQLRQVFDERWVD